MKKISKSKGRVWGSNRTASHVQICQANFPFYAASPPSTLIGGKVSMLAHIG